MRARISNHRNPVRLPRPLVAVALGACLVSAPPSTAQNGFVNFETPHVSPLAITGDTLLAVNTADNRLEVFDVSGAVPLWVRSIPVGLDPVSVRLRSATEAWVVNHLSDSISIVDLPSGRVTRTIFTGDEPADVAFAGSPPRAFVSVSQMNQVRVFDPANLGAPPIILQIQGEDPRALAVSADGSKVFAAIFESGNLTTAIRQQDVSNPSGPYAGRNPPPNSGNAFVPPLNAGNPPPPPVAHIVKRDAAGAWRDDNGRNWSAFVTWNLLDHDVAIIDPATLAVTYADHMLSTVTALAVRPDGVVTAVGLDATNEIRFEPNLRGKFARVRIGSFDPAAPAATSTADLNPHLNYATSSIPQAQRDLSLGDPRGVAWQASSGRAFVTGMGSDSVIVTDATGARYATIFVGAGPTGIVFSADGGRAFVLNRFEGSISALDASAYVETGRTSFYDPTPTAIRVGRPLLYNTRLSSGLGHVSCATCHVDARTDFLAWDLGDPSGEMKAFNQECRTPTCADWHPMKGPMVTQSLQGIVGNGPMHWRGDREDVAAFSVAFTGLQGADAEPSPEEMQLLNDFLLTVRYPPNPNRTLNNALPATFPTTGGTTGSPATGGNLFRTLPVLGGGATCVSCHALPVGTTGEIDNPPLPLAPQPLKIAQLRGMHEKTGWLRNSAQSPRGFGFNHHSEFDTLFALLGAGFNFAPGTVGLQQRRDIEAFLLCLDPGMHSGVGQQVTFDGTNNDDPTLVARFNTFVALANSGAVGLIAKGVRAGEPRGWTYLSANAFQADRIGETIDANALRAGAAPGGEVTFTLVPRGVERRSGVDRDADGYLDGDERDAGSAETSAGDTPVPLRRGDLNCDGLVNFDDIDGFVLALVNPAQFGAQFPDCYPGYADANLDGRVDFDDIDGFVACLIGMCP